MSKAVKEMMTQELASFFEGLESCLVVSCHGMSVQDTDATRQELSARGLRLKVVKNSLAARALERVDKADVVSLLDGPSAFLLSDDGPVGAAKAVVDIGKKQPLFALRGAYVEGSVLSAEQAKDLAKIPPREVLLSQILAGIQAPLSGLAGALSGVSRQLVMVVKAVADSKGSPGEEASDES